MQVLDQTDKAKALSTGITLDPVEVPFVFNDRQVWGGWMRLDTLWVTGDQFLGPLLFLSHRGVRPHPNHRAGLCGGHRGRGTGTGPGLSALSGNLRPPRIQPF